MECLSESEHFLISVPIGTSFRWSGLRAGLREGAAVSRGDVVRYLSRNHFPCKRVANREALH